MELITVLIIASTFLVIPSAFAQNYEWAKRIGGTADQYTNDMAVDNQSNVYIVGCFGGTNIDFDPGTGTAYLSSAGGIDIFMAKFDSSGNYLWAKRIGETSDDIAARMKIDHSGNIYIAGWFESANVDFDPGSGTAILSSAGFTDIFFAKYDQDGNYLWANRIGTSLADACHDMDVDYLNNVYITGSFFGSNTDFDPGPGTAYLSSMGNSGDIFFAKYDSLGNYLWAKSAGGSNYEVGNGIATDNSGNVYLAGPFSGTDVDFDPGPGTAYLSSAGWYDIFFAKYDSLGDYLWAKGIGGTDYDNVVDIMVDSLSDIHLTCYFQGTSVDFDPGAGTFFLSSVGGFDIGLAKYDTFGDLLWANGFGGPGDDGPGEILLDEDANIYLTGWFTGTNVDFDPGPDTACLNSNGNADIFLGKYNSLGEYLWAVSVGGTDVDYGNGIAINSSKRIYLSGGFRGTNVDFDPGTGTAYLSSAGGDDIFMAKYYPLSGPYLGQTPPDSIPKRFPPSSLLSNGAWWWHGSPVFSPEGTEMYFVKYISTSDRMEMYCMEIDQNGEWTSPQRPSFASDSGDNSPVFTVDGNRLLFTSFRDGSTKIYQVTRTESGWSAPELVNMDYSSLPGDLGWFISLTADEEAMYFAIYTPSNAMDIYKSELVNGQYSQFEKLPDQINSTSKEAVPYIAPDESYIIFMSNRPGGYGGYDLYISYKKPDGTWTTAKNMGNKINSFSEEAFPLLSPDGKYLFFNSVKSEDLGFNAYWVNASFLCRLGDADNSGNIDISDVIYLINYLFRGGPAPEPMFAGDSNNDNEVTVADIIYLINYLFRGGPKPSC